jgi:hypothetical protein
MTPVLRILRAAPLPIARMSIASFRAPDGLVGRILSMALLAEKCGEFVRVDPQLRDAPLLESKV